MAAKSAKKGPTLIVTIPAYNEEATLGAVIESIPKSIEGVGKILVLVVDDGSTDNTAQVARDHKAILIQNPVNKGLAFTYNRALEEALQAGADIMVNTDADNQYDQAQIPALIAPILEGKADMVLGSRFAGNIEYMPFSKIIGNQIASLVLKKISGYNISDGQTGFRALSRDAAMRLNILSSFTYTQETILDAADKGLRVAEVPCSFRKRADKSRLFNGILDYMKRAAHTVIVGNLKLRPISSFGAVGLIIIALATMIGWPVILHYISNGVIGEIFLMRAIITGVLFIIGIEIAAFGLLAALIKQNRLLVEKQIYESRRARLSK